LDSNHLVEATRFSVIDQAVYRHVFDPGMGANPCYLRAEIRVEFVESLERLASH